MKIQSYYQYYHAESSAGFMYILTSNSELGVIYHFLKNVNIYGIYNTRS